MNNNIILTGPPRSGTTLGCFLLNKVSNVIALHEPMNLKMFSNRETAIVEIDLFFQQMRRMALEEGKVISKIKSGKIPDNPFGKSWFFRRHSQVKRDQIKIEKSINKDFKLVIKHNGHFTFLLDELVKNYPCYAIIRNPLSCIASWNTISAPVSKGNLTVLKGLNPKIYYELDRIPNLIDRQIKLLDYLYNAYNILSNDRIIRYENIISSGGNCLTTIVPEAEAINEPLESKNRNKLYKKNNLKEIAKRLYDTDGAFWKYYSKEEIDAVVEKTSS